MPTTGSTTDSKLVKPSYIGRRTNVDVLFFGEAPGPEEHRAKEAFVGKSGQLLRDCIRGCIPGLNCVLDNVCPVYLGRNGKDFISPNKAVLEHWNEYVIKSIRKHKPRAIVALGKVALKGLGQPGKKVVPLVGNVFTFEDVKCVVSVHPSYISRNTEEMHLLQTSFNSLDTVLDPTEGKDVKELKTLGQISKWLKFTSGKLVGFDLESSDLDPRKGVLLTAAIAYGKKSRWFSLYHKEGPGLAQADKRLELLKKWFPKQNQIVIQNTMHEHKWMVHLGAQAQEGGYDTMLEQWLIDENVPKSLNYIVINRLHEYPYWSEINHAQMADTPVKKVGVYNALDALYCLWAHGLQKKLLDDARNKHLDVILIPAFKLLARMELQGIKLDIPGIEEIIVEQEDKLSGLKKLIRKNFGNVNINSPLQMQKLLFNDLKLTPLRKTKSGHSTDAETLEHLSKKNRKLKAIIEARKIQHHIGTELSPLLELQHRGFISTHWGFARTGRLTSSNPNLQNITREAGHKRCLISRFRDGKIVVLDYQQNELRIMAAQAGEHYLLKAFERGEDAHQVTADRLRIDRLKGKTLNLALIYGMWVMEFQAQTGWPKSRCFKLRKQWIEQHPNIVKFWDKEEAEARELGYLTNPFGRRRHLDNLDEVHQLKQAYNFKDQSYAMGIVLWAMVEIDRHFRSKGMKSQVIHQIHDSIILDCPAREAKKAAKVAEHIMTHLDLPMKVPLAVDVKIGEHM